MITKKTPIILDKLTIERDLYGIGKGKLKGEVRFSSVNGTIYLKINEDHVQKILDMCADALLETTREMADVMRSDIIEGVTTEKKLELK